MRVFHACTGSSLTSQWINKCAFLPHTVAQQRALYTPHTLLLAFSEQRVQNIKHTNTCTHAEPYYFVIGVKYSMLQGFISVKTFSEYTFFCKRKSSREETWLTYGVQRRGGGAFRESGNIWALKSPMSKVLKLLQIHSLIGSSAFY